MSRYQNINDSLVPIAGYQVPDAGLDSESTKPIQNQAVANPIEAMVNLYGSKNLLPNNAANTSWNGITFTVNSDGTITASGTATGAVSLLLTCNIGAGDYILSGCPVGGTVSTYNVIAEIDGAYDTTNRDYGEGVSLHANTGITTVAIIVEPGTAITTPIIFKPMIRDPRIADDTYVPYAMTNRDLTLKSIANETSYGIYKQGNLVTLRLTGCSVSTLKGLTLPRSAEKNHHYFTVATRASNGAVYYLGFISINGTAIADCMYSPATYGSTGRDAIPDSYVLMGSTTYRTD